MGIKKKKKKANSPQGRWAGLYNLDSRAARTSSAGAAATENRCITGFARELLFKPVFSFWSYSWWSSFHEELFQDHQNISRAYLTFIGTKGPWRAVNTALCCSFTAGHSKQNKSFQRESLKAGQIVQKKKTHSEIPASRQKVANDFSQCRPPHSNPSPPTSSCTGMRGMQWCKCTIIWGFYQQAKSPSPCCS